MTDAATLLALAGRWQRVNDEPFEYAIQQGPHGDEFVNLLDGTCLRRHAQLQPDLPAETGVIHKLKTWPDYFNDILSGRKLFEWRIEDDRLYRVGDVLLLQEWVPVSENLGCKEGKYTGREIRKLVSYRFVTFPTNKRTVVMSLAPVGASALPSTPSGTESSVPASEDRTDGR